MYSQQGLCFMGLFIYLLRGCCSVPLPYYLSCGLTNYLLRIQSYEWECIEQVVGFCSAVDNSVSVADISACLFGLESCDTCHLIGCSMIRYAVTWITIQNTTIIYQSQSHAMWQLNHYTPYPRHFKCYSTCCFTFLCRPLANFVQKFDLNAILSLNRYGYIVAVWKEVVRTNEEHLSGSMHFFLSLKIL